MDNPTDSELFDVIVIGAGSSGENVADRAVRHGLSAAVVEAGLVGGECSYFACMPSKALLRPGQALEAARRVGGAREAVSGGLEVAAVIARRDRFTSHWDDGGQVEWLDGAGISLVRGRGRLAGPRRVEVETPTGQVTLAARYAVAVATGSEPALPPVPGLEAARPWTTRDATSAGSPPGRLAVLGGGVAGCELAQAWSRLGSSVVLIEQADRLLSRIEPFAGELLREVLSEEGIEVRTGTSVSQVSRSGAGVTLELDGGETIGADELLVAAGRAPRTTDLGLETVGLQGGNWLEVDDTMTVGGIEGDWLYAVGDVNHRVLLTHQGKYQARVCGDVIAGRAGGRLETSEWGRHAATADRTAVPQVVFTDPEVAAVGRTAAQARADGLAVREVDYDLGQVAGAALYADGYRGHARLVVDEGRHVVVGATFVGAGVAELCHSATIAVVGEVPLERLWHAVPSYPTMSEVWLRLLESYGVGW